MPGSARLDAPGILHHVIRGIERKDVFRVKADKEDFVDRLSPKPGQALMHGF